MVAHLDHVESNNSKPKQNMSNTNNTESKTTPEVRKLIRLWITGNDKRDARKLSKDLSCVSTDISFWLDVITETRQAT